MFLFTGVETPFSSGKVTLLENHSNFFPVNNLLRIKGIRGKKQNTDIFLNAAPTGALAPVESEKMVGIVSGVGGHSRGAGPGTDGRNSTEGRNSRKEA